MLKQGGILLVAKSPFPPSEMCGLLHSSPKFQPVCLRLPAEIVRTPDPALPHALHCQSHSLRRPPTLGQAAGRTIRRAERWCCMTAAALPKSSTSPSSDFPNTTFPAQVHHPEGSPLVLCDGCPRAFHLACMRGVAWADLPSGEWHCPRCTERRGAALRKLADFEARKHEALERWVALVHP